MTLRRRMTLVVVAGLVAGTLARSTDATGTTSALVFLTTCLVLGMLLVLRLENGQAPGELRVFLYDLGKNRGYRLVGIERPEP